MKPFFYYLLLINAAAILIMLIDKRNAIKRRQRIPEALLLGLSVCGGSYGTFCAMYLFRHKTRKPVFSVGLPLLICIHTVVILYAIK